MILIICAAYSFLGNSSLLGPSVYIGIYSESFGISPAVASGLISYPNLSYGFGMCMGNDATLVAQSSVADISRIPTLGSCLSQIWSSTGHVALYHCCESRSELRACA